MGLAEPPPAGGAMLPTGTFEGEVVVVTGGGTGLGRAIAVEFARLGARLAIVSRDAEHRQRGLDAVRAVSTGDAVDAQADVRDPDQVAAAFDEIEATLGSPGVLVNNAAGNFPVRAEAMSPRGWRAVTQIVLDGAFFCSQELAKRCIANGRHGAILNIAATYAWTGGPGTAHSAAAKAAVVNLTQSLAVEWAPFGIRVNGLAPGLFLHDDVAPAMRSGRTDEEAAATVPAGRTGRLHELGWAATWLCSPYAAYVTGHTLVVDGGNWLRRGLRMDPFVPVSEQLGGTGSAP